MFKLERINQKEAIRYLGYKNNLPDEKIQGIIDQCERELLSVIEPRFLYRCFDINRDSGKLTLDGCEISLDGNDIKNHLDGCEKAILLCATLSAGADRIIRIAQLEDMTRAVILDSLSSAAIEQVCNAAEESIRSDFGDYFMTWRFSPGYGDFPIEVQKNFIAVMNAPKRIGLNVTDSFILVPKKSVTAIIGLSKNAIEQKKRGCQTCNMTKNCTFKKRGEHCGF